MLTLKLTALMGCLLVAGCAGPMDRIWDDPIYRDNRERFQRADVETARLDKPKHEIWQQSCAHWVEPSPLREGFQQGFTRPVGIGSPTVDPEQDKF